MVQNYYYHERIKRLKVNLKVNLNLLVKIQKDTKIIEADKEGDEDITTVSYELIFSDSSALARKLKLLTFSWNWENMVGDKKNIFVITCWIEGNAILGKKYFRAIHYTIHTNHHWHMFFSLFIIKLVEIWQLLKNWLKVIWYDIYQAKSCFNNYTLFIDQIFV